MKYGKKYMNLEKGLQTEWLITNGIGGYSSSTIISANTRRYHGLLIASLTPPARRFVILSKLDESIIIDKNKYNLYTNVGKEYLSEGYKYQKEFEKNEIPIFTYEIKDVKIEKTICMDYGKNTVVVLYKIKNGNSSSKLILSPVMNFRDFHQMTTNHNFYLKQIVSRDKVRIEIDGNANAPIYIHCSEGNYIMHENDEFKNMLFVKVKESAIIELMAQPKLALEILNNEPSTQAFP